MAPLQATTATIGNKHNYFDQSSYFRNTPMFVPPSENENVHMLVCKCGEQTLKAGSHIALHVPAGGGVS